ncbi:DUF4352 domain-containing protein [Listeria rocourtiae]|uniref:DUF4352 domain-containing protein n=1 Tax=Listeria rocourtiae TaxID=647910 RepID=UPI0016264337|nr:DUF4352 domain-containing protein [Listeria rocourtiae]MBC1435173.1 DUF4352 domain-containing protein [Listeria rocourtiae]
MKKIILLLSSLFAVSILVSCQQNEEPKKTETKATQHAFPRNNTATVASLKIEMLGIKAAENSLPKHEKLEGKKLVKVDMRISNMTEYEIPIAASLFKVLDSNGKYQTNYPMVDELGQTIVGNKEVRGVVYFVLPKNSAIEKIVYEDSRRDAFHEWTVEK